MVAGNDSNKSLIGWQALRATMRYDQYTGEFHRLKPPKKGRTYKRVGSLNNCGYLEIGLEGQRYLAHRLAWFYIHGEWPKDQIDHVNRVRHDNRIKNLREATPGENQQNLIRHRKYPGTTLVARTGKYKARISVGGRVLELGSFDTQEEAAAAYLSAKVKHHRFIPAGDEHGSGS